jgi:CRISPR-associated protein Cas2
MIVAYDIADPRRLARIARIMKDYGKRVQKSVFEVNLTENLFQEMKGRTERNMNLGEDGVKYYPLCERCSDILAVMGRSAPSSEDGELLIV